MSETDIQADILVAISGLPHSLWWRNNTGRLPTATGRWVSFGVLGSPDICGILNGRFVGIEVKTSRGRQRISQRRFQAACERAGGLYVVARTVGEALDAIR